MSIPKHQEWCDDTKKIMQYGAGTAVFNARVGAPTAVVATVMMADAVVEDALVVADAVVVADALVVADAVVVADALVVADAVVVAEALALVIVFRAGVT